MISSSMIRLANIVNRENNEYEIHCLEESRDQTTSLLLSGIGLVITSVSLMI